MQKYLLRAITDILKLFSKKDFINSSRIKFAYNTFFPKASFFSLLTIYFNLDLFKI